MAQHGSLINQIMDNSWQSLEPAVGMGATLVCWSDRHAGTIVDVSRTGYRVVWQRDRATRLDSNGMSDSQRYAYSPEPASARETFTRRKDGSYRLVGTKQRLLLGVRDEHYDYSF